MTDKNANTEIRKEFCPNCEAETPCTHEAELYVCDICGEDFAKYIVSRSANVSDVSMTRGVSTDVKTPESIENTNPDYYKQELARRDQKITELEKSLHDQIIEDYEKLVRRDDLIKRLVSAGQNMYFTASDDPEEIRIREFETWRLLMKELEGKCQKT